MNISDWEEYTKKVKKLASKDKKKPHFNNAALNNNLYSITKEDFKLHALEVKNFSFIDNTHKTKLRKIKNQSIDASIDLHGFIIEKAKIKFIKFILNAKQQGLNTILVVTGKGQFNEQNQYEGKLKNELPKWAQELSEIIKYFIQAPPKLGGEGAYIIKLRN
ncbi:Smr/MutS family protein [Rickettsiales endosymbiont of Stachyamoeba lipophora]|uniref:Smr/MutS family protein n=1 Tax=Rickettsiales endosymbiont of Stachyamoeba lipophora TaxID=2486578 RepID=UPI000F653E9D|nr:Smr/MutS family protein [Rickettsiales endosymbiont of Stachyamoeba lipophora]AZL15750.1 hypothetical protein EF513_04215 [Rickettsiales endosymbiont of Stachyamoeba lipophora]